MVQSKRGWLQGSGAAGLDPTSSSADTKQLSIRFMRYTLLLSHPVIFPVCIQDDDQPCVTAIKDLKTAGL